MRSPQGPNEPGHTTSSLVPGVDPSTATVPLSAESRDGKTAGRCLGNIAYPWLSNFRHQAPATFAMRRAKLVTDTTATETRWPQAVGNPYRTGSSEGWHFCVAG